MRPRNYSFRRFGKDALAGLIAAVAAIPAAMASATLAGLPPYVGLWAILVPPLVYPLFGTSKDLVLSPTPAAAALVGATVIPLAAKGLGSPVALAAALSLVVSGVMLLAAALRLGFLAHTISRPVLVGYGLGLAVVVGLGELATLLGVEATSDEMLWGLTHLSGKLLPLHLFPALFGMSCLAAVELLRPLLRLGPASAVVLLAASGGYYFFELHNYGISVVGETTRGLPQFDWPGVNLQAVVPLLWGGLALALLLFIDSTSIARAHARPKQEHINLNRELLGVGAANLTSGLSSAVPLGGSEPDTALLRFLGAKSAVASWLASGVVLLVLLVGWEFANLPEPALSAVILATLRERVDLKTLRAIRQFSPRELLPTLVAFVGVVSVGVVAGILIAVVTSLFLVLLGVGRPHIAQLGIVPGAPALWVDVKEDTRAQEQPDICVMRVDAAVFFINANYVADSVKDRCLPKRPRAVVLDLESAWMIDFTGCYALERLRHDLAEHNVELLVANANFAVRQALVRQGLGEALQISTIVKILTTCCSSLRNAKRRPPRLQPSLLSTSEDCFLGSSVGLLVAAMRGCCLLLGI